MLPSLQKSGVALLLGLYLLGSDNLVLFLNSAWSAFTLYHSCVQEV